MNEMDRHQIRLSDRILSALELALEQEDVKISELLTLSLIHISEPTRPY